MDVKTVITVLVLIAVSLGVTVWLGVSSVEEEDVPSVTYESEGEEKAPPVDEEGPRPKAVAEETEYQFGTMELGETGKHTFLLKNGGEDVLVIAKGASTCKCTVSDLPTNEIPPGETVEVLLEWKPKSFSPEFSQKARIWTNDPEQRAIDFRVSGRVADLLSTMPQEAVEAGDVQENIGAKARFRMFSAIAEKFDEPPTIEYDGEFLEFEIEPMDELALSEFSAMSGYTVWINVSPQVPAGNGQETFTYHATVNEREYEEQVTVNYSRRGPLRIMPLPGTVYFEKYGLVDFQRFNVDDGKTQEVTLLIEDPEDGSPIEVSVGEVEAPQIKVTAKPKPEMKLKGKQAFRLIFEIPPGTPPVDYARKSAPKVMINTTHPVIPEIEIHVEAHSR